ncbi:Nose resistant-to-fluoxetine protein N-terminal domain-containing protein [Caenorhabditis elegans]|uniref:Nose resistant-to-fluoxetine protein N-terminal domain-containing protein n=1 Tax=Caenorhabditis elegans TaxID=6239 RepID=A0A0K3ASI3_CAEEL|nr:Nose resistant-to-fluoxetine protein N-terminal domain-containing protein [Caenorhabditis elegans]CTQ86814.1 Nose resistant-to-fluoxetine protein N-terminal domain-containing protein [Caenorhabditis elegans]|eukprot:NP_001300115.1 O-ACyltransferase homolog [Caenorhabditis elegans]
MISQLIFLIILLLNIIPTTSATWKDVIKPKPLDNLSAQCLNDTNTWINSLEIFGTLYAECIIMKKCNAKELKVLRDNLYAVQQLDAFGQFPGAGLLELKTLYDGSYQECQRVSGKKYDVNYCYLLLTPGKNVSSCAPSNSKSLYSQLPLRIAVCLPDSCNHQDMIDIFNELSPYPFTACSAYCTKNEVKKDTPFWGFSIFLIVMVVIAAIASIVDYVRETVYGLSSQKENNTFFKILLTFSLWTNAELLLSVKEQKSGFIKSLDCIRLLSMCWVVTDQMAPQAAACKTLWWQNLLYINNFDDGNSQNSTCYGITWYLAVDTQLYLVAPIVLVALYFSFAAGTAIIVAGCVGSIITTYILFGVYNVPADIIGNGDQTKFFNIAYSKPWIRCPPYLVGLLTGYLLATYGSRKIRLNWALAIAGWITAFVIAGFCLFATYDYDKGAHWSTFTRATFYNFHRLGWGVFVCWVVGANHMGWGGPIDKFMSHPIWQPFGRLSYCAYIVHWMVLYYYLNVGGVLHYSSAWQVFTYIAIPATLLSYVLAFFWSCLFEVPILKLEKMLIEKLIGGGGRTSLKVEDLGKNIGKVPDEEAENEKVQCEALRINI